MKFILNLFCFIILILTSNVYYAACAIIHKNISFFNRARKTYNDLLFIEGVRLTMIYMDHLIYLALSFF